MGINRGTVLDLINDVHRAGGFKDYNSYSYIFDQVDTMPESKEDTEPHWIPVEQALPEEPFGCLVTVWDEEPMTGEMFENLLPYFVGWDGEQWNDADGEQCPFEVLAWWRLPEPYKGVTNGRD